MASRYWLAKWSSGYVGTNDEEAIDLVVDWSYEEKDVESMTDEEVQKNSKNCTGILPDA
jgi:hypothetical protein